MYQELWDRIPGVWWVKLLVVAVVVVVIAALLLEVVFPWVGPMLPGADVQVVSPDSG